MSAPLSKELREKYNVRLPIDSPSSTFSPADLVLFEFLLEKRNPGYGHQF